jgi:hypothetical protein
VIGESSLGKLEPFAEGASAVLFRGKMDKKKARLSNPNMMAKQQKKAELQNTESKPNSKAKEDGMVVAVKLARSREGQIHEDVEVYVCILWHDCDCLLLLIKMQKNKIIIIINVK